MGTLNIFPWNENFNTGVQKIDEQHQRLVELLNLLASHVFDRGELPKLNDIFEELTAYTVYHFQTEELIWHQYLQDDLLEQKHQEVHQNFISKISDLKAKAINTQTDKVIEEILSFLTRWLASHILETDRNMAMVVKAMQSGLPLETAKEKAKEQMGGTMRVLIDIILSNYTTHVANTLHLMKEVVEHKLVEQSQKRVERALKLLSECGTTLIHAESERALLNAICKLAVETGGYLMAWVGLVVFDESKSIRPVAQSGYENGYLDNLSVTWSDTPLGQGPLGVSIRTRSVVLNQDYQNNPHMAPWHDAASKRGYRASIALPLFIDNQVYGVLSIYAAEKDAFENEEVGLLKELASNLSYGIEAIHNREENLNARIALKKETEKLVAILRNASDGIHILDVNANLIEASDSFCTMLGYQREELIGKNVSFWDAECLSPPEIAKNFEQQFNKIGRSEFETRHRRKDGTIFDVEVSGMALKLEGKPALFNSSRDITERKHNDALVYESEEKMRGIFEGVLDGIVLVNAKTRRYNTGNHSFSNMLGYNIQELEQLGVEDFHPGEELPYVLGQFERALRGDSQLAKDIPVKRKDGTVFFADVNTARLNFGGVDYLLANFRDITERKEAEKAINNLAFYDPLTALPNRRLLNDRLHQARLSSLRSGRYGALLFIDLDNFKDINDTHGHRVGDMLLQQVAQRLTSCVRDEDTLARQGGDEFIVVVEGLNEQINGAATQAEAIGEKIIAALYEPYRMDSHVFRGGASLGITLFNGNQTIDELLKQSDIAMYQAKKAGGNSLRFFDQKMQETIAARSKLEEELMVSLEKAYFHLYFQIQVEGMGRPIGAEALIRWISPDRGMISPLDFIPLAETTGLIIPIGQWVLETACATLKEWQKNAVTRELVLAVNVSSQQFKQRNFAELVGNAVKRHSINPKLLKLELTESMLLENIEETISSMDALKAIGVQLSLDDFGTGYSSLQYLKRLPIDQIKIDQSFVRDITTDPNDAAIVKTIIAMAETLGLDVIAEGVETEAQREFLKSRGCNSYQGYYFGKPVPADVFLTQLRPL